MKELIQWIKKVSLFLAGIILVIWGYKVNATNNAKVKDSDKIEDEPQTSSIFNTIELKDSVISSGANIKGNIDVKSGDTPNKQKEKVVLPSDNKKMVKDTIDNSEKDKVVIESDKKVEESSGTQ